jgi:hypothetical protein
MLRDYLFHFEWTGVKHGNPWNEGTSLRDVHTRFNGAFAREFPKLRHTAPWTNYTNETFWSGATVSGGGESRQSDPNQIRRLILSHGIRAGFADAGNLLVEAIPLDDLAAGIGGQFNINQNLAEVPWWATTDGTKNLTFSPTNLLGISTTTLYLLGLAALLLITRR